MWVEETYRETLNSKPNSVQLTSSQAAPSAPGVHWVPRKCMKTEDKGCGSSGFGAEAAR